MLLSLSQKALSDTFGATSVTCWLFAQFPQVVENYRRSSCHGLALPFLVNWLLGDVSNLVGCIFTDQLPFQTYLATYFTIIDMVLICQYLYYTRRNRRLRHAHQHHHHHRTTLKHSRLSASQHSTGPHHDVNRLQRSRPGIASRTNTISASSRIAVASPARSVHTAEWPQTSPHDLQSTHEQPPTLSRNHSLEHAGHGTPISEMSESLHAHLSSASVSTLGAMDRGRAVTRFVAPDHHIEQYESIARRQTSGSRGRPLQSSRDGSLPSRSSSVVFLSVWTLVGVSGLGATLRHHVSRRDSSENSAFAWKAGLRSTTESITSSLPALATAAAAVALELDPEPIDYSRLVGRVAAWMCVCFYLTSRMPQIWKNFQRQSVEGLSILLFAAAFAGNTFYVMSVLSSPLVQEEEGYLFESVPFLLGSGGTLVFDLTIMTQAYMYRKNRSNGPSSNDLGTVEEHAGLLGSQS